MRTFASLLAERSAAEASPAAALDIDAISLAVASRLIEAAAAMAGGELTEAPPEADGAPATPSATVRYVGLALAAVTVKGKG